MNIRKGIQRAWEGVRNENELHPGLCFFTFFDGNTENPDDKKRHLERVQRLRLTTARQLLERRRREESALGNMGYELVHWKQRLLTRMAAGLGIESPLDNGITLDRTHGVPLLVGTTLKGLAQDQFLASVCQMEDPEAMVLARWEAKNDPEFIAIFGIQTPLRDEKPFGLKWQESAWRGHVLFLDALVEPPHNVFDIDIVNPHYGPYYGGSEPPADYLKPNPNAFLCVNHGIDFQFAVAGRNADVSIRLTPVHTPPNPSPPTQTFSFVGTDLVRKASELVQNALQHLGAGGKTRVGYGYFGNPSTLSPGD